MSQFAGVFIAVNLIFRAISGYFQWRRRKPDDALGAPSANVPARLGAIVVIMLVLAALLPLLTL